MSEKSVKVTHRHTSMLLAAVLFGSLLAGLAVSQSTMVSSLCNLVIDVQEAVFIVALALLTLGGALYATAHMLPAQQRGALQGYGMGMLIGGVVGVILVALAPFVVEQLLGTSNPTGLNIGVTACPTLFGTINLPSPGGSSGVVNTGGGGNGGSNSCSGASWTEGGSTYCCPNLETGCHSDTNCVNQCFGKAARPS